jgi:hypothetical protein
VKGEFDNTLATRYNFKQAGTQDAGAGRTRVTNWQGRGTHS